MQQRLNPAQLTDELIEKRSFSSSIRARDVRELHGEPS
jgi:hypothetical protein